MKMSGKSESEKERKCKRSACWHFYDKTTGGGFCRICQKEILTQAGGTTNLRNHLRRKHGELWTAIMENRLDPATLSVRPGASQIVSESLENQSSNFNCSMAQETLQDRSVDFSFYNEEVVASEEDASEAAAETNSAVHTIQAYRDVNGTTFLYLQPHTEGESNVQIQNAQFQPGVTTSETITANGEIVSVAVHKDTEGQAAEGEAKVQEEATPRKIVHAPVKTYQGSSVPTRTVVRQLARPNPIKTSTPAASSNSHNNIKEDSFEAFGKYIATMLRNLPSKSAWKLQGEIVNWILKEQIKNTES